MVSDVLPDMKKLEYFYFEHNIFTNTKKMKDILEELGMKPVGWNDDWQTKYGKE